MADREVTKSRKDKDRDITALCKSGEGWSPRLKQDAINDIEGGLHTYHVMDAAKGRVEIKVVQGSTGKYLRTDPDKTTKNNLDDLPDC